MFQVDSEVIRTLRENRERSFQRVLHRENHCRRASVIRVRFFEILGIAIGLLSSLSHPGRSLPKAS